MGQRRKKDAPQAPPQATAGGPLEADSQLPLYVPRPPTHRPRGTPAWLWKKHLGYYGGAWVCQRCGGSWAMFTELAKAPACDGPPF